MRLVHPVLQQIREERLRQGLTLVDLAKKAGYESNHIWNLEHGKCRAKIDIVADLAQALGMEIVLKERVDE